MDAAIAKAAAAKEVAILTTKHDTASTIQFIRGSRRIEEAISTDFIRFDGDTLVQGIPRGDPGLFPTTLPGGGTRNKPSDRRFFPVRPRRSPGSEDRSRGSQRVLPGGGRSGRRPHPRSFGSPPPQRQPHLEGTHPLHQSPRGQHLHHRRAPLLGSGPHPRPLRRHLHVRRHHLGHLELPPPPPPKRTASSSIGSPRSPASTSTSSPRSSSPPAPSSRVLRPPEALRSDRKEYQESGYQISISQIEELGLSHLWPALPSLQAELAKSAPTRSMSPSS